MTNPKNPILTERTLNKLLQKAWDTAGSELPDIRPIVKLGAGFGQNKRKGKYYRVVYKEYERVYKKYNYQPKPEKAKITK